jgi:hypothetical protein
LFLFFFVSLPLLVFFSNGLSFDCNALKNKDY